MEDELKNEFYELKKEILYVESMLECVIDNDSRIEKYHCPICGSDIPSFRPFGIKLRKNAQCPKCGSLERHRAFYVFLKKYTNIFYKNNKLLHFAPESTFYNLFKSMKNIDYVTADIQPSSLIDEQMDIQDIPYPDNSIDVFYASHVLEHVEDDKKALKEIYRIIKPKNKGGYALIVVPIIREKTIEDPKYNTPELRTKYYGQFDHMRAYGKDFKKRLEDVGFEVEEYITSEFIDPKDLKKWCILKDYIFLCKK